MKALSLVSMVLLSLTFVGCSPDDVPAGGNPPLRPMPSEEGLSKLLNEDALIVESRVDVNLESRSDLGPARTEFESQQTTYSCRATMEDQLQRTGQFCRGCADQPYRLLRYYTFNLEHGQRIVHLSELSYEKLAAVGALTYKVNQDILVEAANTEVRMTFLQGENEDDKSIELALQPSQKVEDILVSDRDHKVFAFGAPFLEATNQLSVQMLLKTETRIDLREGDSLVLDNGEIVIESGKGAEVRRETFQIQSLGAIKTTVTCELMN